VPSTAPVSVSMIRIGPPPSERSDTIPAADWGCVQNQPVGRRRRCPLATSEPSTCAAVGPKLSISSARSGCSAAAAHRCGAST
jgi:hypothetical protein